MMKNLKTKMLFTKMTTQTMIEVDSLEWVDQHVYLVQNIHEKGGQES